jgi:hemerythrin-like metal-binding protein
MKKIEILKWTSNLSIKNEVIDNQHKGLIDAVNELFDRAMSGDSKLAIEKAVDFLDKYWREHFGYEEKYMESINYPGLPEQKRLHKEFINNYNKIKKRMIVEKDSAKLIVEIEQYIGDWLINHIAKVDHKILEFVESQKIYDVGSKKELGIQSAELVESLSSVKEQMLMRMKAKKLEVALRKANIELTKSNRLKDLFMDIMRHDLLNPAGIVKMSSQLALLEEKDVKKRETLEKIIRNNSRVIRMIENASILAKLESGEKIEFKEEDLGVMLKGSVEELGDRAKERGMKVRVVVKGKFMAIVNPLIQNVFSNFISNAIKYSPEKTEVVVGIKARDDDWLVYVEDRGEGIPAKYKKAVFERFTRLEKGAVKGTGLGLAISKKITSAHGGKIWVGDHKGGGAVFYVLVPKVRGDNVNSVVAHNSVPPKKGVGAPVLLGKKIVKRKVVDK